MLQLKWHGVCWYEASSHKVFQSLVVNTCGRTISTSVYYLRLEDVLSKDLLQLSDPAEVSEEEL